jgi:hypothetical protein
MKGNKVLIGKREGKRTFEIPTRRWENDIKMDIKQVVKSFVF